MFYTISKLFWLGAAPSNLLVIITGVAALWATLRRSKYAAWLGLTGACCLFIGSFTPVGLWLMAPLENRFPPWHAEGRATPDGIILIGGEGVRGILALVELSRRFPRANLFVSGEGEEFYESKNLVELLTRLGGDPKRYSFESRSRNTFENALYSRQIIKPPPHQRWLLITSAAHMPRAVGCFRHEGFQVDAYPINFKTKNKPSSVFEFGAGSTPLSQLDSAAKEWVGLLAYRLTGKTDSLFPAPKPLRRLD